MTSPSGIWTPRSTTTLRSRALRLDPGIGQDDRALDVGDRNCTRTPVNSSERRTLEPETMQPPETIVLIADAAAALEIVDELGRRGELDIGPDRPALVVEIERRDDVGEVDVGLPVGVDRADVAPVGFLLGAGAHARGGEAVGHRLAVARRGRE